MPASVTIINGGGTAETLTGTIGADLIDGGLGDDILIGSAGGDTLTGGAGSDRFSYALASHSSLNYLDIITDFSLADGDEIDFSALGLAGGITDGGMVSGFGHGPASDFNGNGIIIETDGTDTRIYADADHSGTFSAHADLVVQVSGNHLGDLISQAAAQIII